jgi:hypothetical protein
MTLHLDLTEDELKDTFDAVEHGTLTAEEAFLNTMTFQSKNRVKRK